MLIKRMVSYIIDLLIVSLITALLLQIRFLHPNYESYEKASNNLADYYEEVLEKQDVNFMNKEEYKHLNYALKKESVTSAIIETTVFILYFVVYQTIKKGQTLGKKLVKLKVTSIDNKDIKWYQLLIRTIILYNLYAGVLSILFLFILPENTYLIVDNFLSTLTSVMFYGSLLMIILRSDGRGIPDFAAKTIISKE